MSNPTLPSDTIANSTTLAAIQTKVRRLTRSPSTALLSVADLNNYINTAVVYDFPEHLRTFNLRTNFNFFTNPGQDVYNTDTISFSGATNNPLYNFQNKYITVHPPFYIAGYQSFFSQNPEQFYGIYPQVNSISNTQTLGDGTPGPFTGYINTNQAIVPPGMTQNISLLQGKVLFNAITSPGTSENQGEALVDIPVVDPTTGQKLNIGNLYDPNGAAYMAALRVPPTVVTSGNFINYLTGQYTITFTNNTIAGTAINSMATPTILSIPQAVLYFSNQFVVRPVPDQVYRINFEVYQRPTALLDTAQSPELEEYWQYIAYLAAKKIFEDRLDMDSVQLIMPELKNQESLCLRRTWVQITNTRTATIYTEQSSFGPGGTGWGFGGGSF